MEKGGDDLIPAGNNKTDNQLVMISLCGILNGLNVRGDSGLFSGG